MLVMYTYRYVYYVYLSICLLCILYNMLIMYNTIYTYYVLSLDILIIFIFIYKEQAIILTLLYILFNITIIYL